MSYVTLKAATLAAALTAILPVAASAHGSEHHARPTPAVASVAAPIGVTPDEIQWKSGPASLPAGAEAAVIEGNPSKKGPFTMRLRFPAGYRIPAHSHPGIEHITVVSGTFGIGMGDALDTSQGREVPAGSFVVMPAGHNHFAWADEVTVVQLHGTGPWGITYVNPADDPRVTAYKSTNAR